MTSQAWLIPEDGEIDELAVYLMVSRTRVVKHTPSERREVISQMVKRGYNSMEIAMAVGTSAQIAMDIIRDLGYEFLPSHCSGGRVTAVPVDRPRKKLLETGDIGPLGQHAFNPSSPRRRPVPDV